MRQVGNPRSELLNNFQGLGNTKMGWMRGVPEGAENERIQPLQTLHAFGWNSTDIGAVGDISNPETEDRETRAMLKADRDDGRSKGLEGVFTDEYRLESRSTSRMRRFNVGESVIESSVDSLANAGFTVQRYSMPQPKREQAEIVQAMNVVRMFMGEDDCINMPDPFANQLMAEVGRGVDQQIAPGEAENRGATRAVVVGVGTGANLTAATDHRYPYRCPRSQQDHPSLDFGI
jgi:hypothetical protein